MQAICRDRKEARRQVLVQQTQILDSYRLRKFEEFKVRLRHRPDYLIGYRDFQGDENRALRNEYVDWMESAVVEKELGTTIDRLKQEYSDRRRALQTRIGNESSLPLGLRQQMIKEAGKMSFGSTVDLGERRGSAMINACTLNNSVANAFKSGEKAYFCPAIYLRSKLMGLPGMQGAWLTIAHEGAHALGPLMGPEYAKAHGPLVSCVRKHYPDELKIRLNQLTQPFADHHRRETEAAFGHSADAAELLASELAADAWATEIFTDALENIPSRVARENAVYANFESFCSDADYTPIDYSVDGAHPSGISRIRIAFRNPRLREALGCGKAEAAWCGI